MLQTITAKQVRMAKGALSWSNKDLAKLTGLHWQTVNKTENGTASRATTMLVKTTLEAQGIEFIGTTGVNLREPEHE